MAIVDDVKTSWGWVGIDPVEVIGENDFGNLLIEDRVGRYWHLCPEDLCCNVVAGNVDELEELLVDEEFQLNWEMRELVVQAENSIGPLSEGRRYCLVTPGVLGGAYAISNIRTAPLREIVCLSGDLANQIKDLPEGASVKLKIVD